MSWTVRRVHKLLDCVEDGEERRTRPTTSRGQKNLETQRTIHGKKGRKVQKRSLQPKEARPQSARFLSQWKKSQGVERCAVCDKVVMAASSFCDLCFERVVKKKPSSASQLRKKNKELEEKLKGLEKAFLVHMETTSRGCVGVEQLSQAEVKRIRERAKRTQLKQHKLRELENAFQINQDKRRAEAKRTRVKQLKALFQNEQALAARELQRIWRGTRQHKRFTRARRGVIKFQARTRGWSVRKDPSLDELRRFTNAARRIQCSRRGQVARKELWTRRAAREQREEEARRIMKARCDASATRLQAALRGKQSRRSYQDQKRKVTKIQSLFRSRQAQKETHAIRVQRNREHASASLIQKTWKLRALRNEINGRIDRKQKRIAALRIQVVARAFLAKQNTKQARQQSAVLEELWIAFEQHFSTAQDPCALLSSPASAFASWFPQFAMFERSELLLQMGFFHLIVKTDFEQAANIFHSLLLESGEHAREEGAIADQAVDPRLLYGLVLSHRMSFKPDLARAVLIDYISRGKLHDTVKNVRQLSSKRSIHLFAPLGSHAAVHPFIYEVDYILRRALLVHNKKSSKEGCDEESKQKGALRTATYGLFRQLIVKDRRGAEFFFQDAILGAPLDTRILAAFYGQNARSGPPAPLQVGPEDFEDAQVILSKDKATVSNFSVSIQVLLRASRCKWGAKENSFDLLLVLAPLPESHETGDVKTLALSYEQLREFARYIDQADILYPAKRNWLVSTIIENVELVKASKTMIGTEARWKDCFPVLRFEQAPVGSSFFKTNAGMSLSLKFFFENCTRLRVVGYCAEIKQTLMVIVDKQVIRDLCLDSPHMKRMFETYGWRSAVNHCKLLQRVMGLLEVVKDAPKQKRKPRNFYEGITWTPLKQPILVKNEIIARQSRCPEEDHPTKGRKRTHKLVLENLDSTILEIRQRWAACKVQALFRGIHGQAEARRRQLARNVTNIQRVWRGSKARQLYAEMYWEFVRHKQATRLAAAFRSYSTRMKWRQSRLPEFAPESYSSLSPNMLWQNVWKTLSIQRLTALNRTNNEVLFFLWKLCFEHHFDFCKQAIRTKRESGDERMHVMLYYVEGLADIMESECEPSENGLALLRAATKADSERLLFRLFEADFFERPTLIHPEKAIGFALLAVVKEFVYDDLASSRVLTAKALKIGTMAGGNVRAEMERIRDVLSSWKRKKQHSAARIQVFWRHARGRPRERFETMVEISCGKLQLGLLTSNPSRKNKMDISEKESLVFAVHAVLHDYALAAELYDKFLVEFPNHHGFLSGRALLRGLDGDFEDLERVASMRASSNDCFIKHFENAVAFHRLSKEPREFAASLLNLSLVRWFVNRDARTALDLLGQSARIWPLDCKMKSVQLYFATNKVFESEACATQQNKDILLQKKAERWLARRGELERLAMQRGDAIEEWVNKRKRLEEQAEVMQEQRVSDAQREAEERKLMGGHDTIMIQRAKHADRRTSEMLLTQAQIAALRKEKRKTLRKQKSKR